MTLYDMHFVASTKVYFIIVVHRLRADLQLRVFGRIG